MALKSWRHETSSRKWVNELFNKIYPTNLCERPDCNSNVPGPSIDSITSEQFLTVSYLFSQNTVVVIVCHWVCRVLQMTSPEIDYHMTHIMSRSNEVTPCRTLRIFIILKWFYWFYFFKWPFIGPLRFRARPVEPFIMHFHCN